MADKIITIDEGNLDSEHICCAISDKDEATGVRAKKEWLKKRFREGLKFRRLDARAKVFIEYLPADYAWQPIDAPGWFFIDCFWVSGSYKGKGHGSALLDLCERDAAASHGVCAIVGAKKMPFLGDGSFMKSHGYEVIDRLPGGYELVGKPFSNEAAAPAFRRKARAMKCSEKGLHIVYSAQCVFSGIYARECVDWARAEGMEASVKEFKTFKEAKDSPSPWATFGLFLEGEFLGHEILTAERLRKRIAGKVGAM